MPGTRGSQYVSKSKAEYPAISLRPSDETIGAYFALHERALRGPEAAL